MFHSPTNLGYLIPRVFMDDTEEDRKAILPLVNQIMAYPLSHYTGQMQTKDWTSVPTFPAAQQSGSEIKWVVPEAFLDALPAVLNEDSPLPGEPFSPPEGVEGLEWILLTSVPTAAWERVDWYRARWIVEDYHQGLKTGCSIEERHLQSYEALRRLLGFLAPAAVRLLQLRAVARETPERLASEFLPTDLVQVVAALAKVPAAELTAQQGWFAIARRGGYLRRRSSGPPGWKTLWKGWFYVQTLLEGVHLASRLSLD